jgi:hypothetical protein
MPASQINKEAIRILVADIGYQEASKQTGIAYGTLRQWAKRGHWFNQIQPHAQAVTAVTKPIHQAHTDALAEMETETRISLARSVRRMSRDAETANLRDVDKVHKAAQTMAIVHRQGEHGAQAGFTLNVLNLGSLGIQVRQDETTEG